MSEARIIEVETPSGDTHTHTTVVTDAPASGGGASWILFVLLAIVAGVAIWYFAGATEAEVAKNNAVAEAADKVGTAAGQVGDAAQDAADAITR